MTLVDKIIASIHAALDWTETVDDGNGGTTDVLHEYPVYYHDDITLNLMTSMMSFPCALLYLLTTGRPVQEGGTLKERVTAAVFFVSPQDCADFDAVDNEAVIDERKADAFAWLKSLNLDGGIELVEQTRSERIYGRYDDILTGYGVQVEIKELIGYC